MSDGDSQQRLLEVEKALEGQAALRAVLPSDLAETAIASLLAEREALLARLEGTAAIAQGNGAVAATQGIAGGRDVIIQGDVVLQKTGPLRDRGAGLERYLRWVMTETGSLTLSGIDPTVKEKAGREARLSLSTVYTGLRTSTPRERTEARLAGPGERERPQSVLEMLDRHSRLVVLGDPGSGKSTFVKFVALCLAGERLGNESANLKRLTSPLPDESVEDDAEDAGAQPWHHGPLLPVRIVLSHFASRGLPAPDERGTAKHVWDFLRLWLEEEGIGDAAEPVFESLRTHRGLILFDGLDEVPESEGRREQIVQALRGFAAGLGDSRVLVTSRPYAYQSQGWRLDDFTETSLAPFHSGQIHFFVGAWYDELVGQGRMLRDVASGQAELLRHAIFGSERLLDLAKRPLLLTLMASLHAGQGGSLPERREQLYAKAVEMLLDTWESQRRVYVKKKPVLVQPSLAEWLKVDRERVLQVLEELAFEVHSAQEDDPGGVAADLKVGRLIELLLRVSRNAGASAEKLLEFLRDRAGLLVERAEGICSFPHRTFQEYLAACYLARRGFPKEVACLGRHDPDRWREVVLLTGAKVRQGAESSVWSLAEALCPCLAKSDPEKADEWGALLAGQVLVESADLEDVEPQDGRKLERIRTWLVQLLRTESFPARERVAAGGSLAALGDPRFDPEHWWLPKEPGLGFVEIPEGPFLMGSDPEADPSERANELPQHPLSLPRYWLSRYPVTVEQYRLFVEESGHRPQDDESMDGDSNLPVVNVTLHEALAYCRWLEARLLEEAGKPERAGALWSDLRSGGLHATLPSEAEWEKAARGDDGKLYPWGNESDPNRASFDETGLADRSAAGCFPGGAGPWGCEDLSGNVWEWTRSEYRDYPYDPADGREVLEVSSRVLRVLRGGAFGFNSGLVRCASRDGYSPDYWGDVIGFRVVLSPFPL